MEGFFRRKQGAAAASHVTPRNTVSVVAQPSSSRLPPSAGMPWGEPIWTFFHALAEQVVPSRYAECRADLARIVREMSASLPCPECAAHATAYTLRVNWTALNTRDDFRAMLCAYHNSVNARKAQPQFAVADLAARYGAVDMRFAAARALHYFEGRHSLSNVGLAPHTFQRTRTAAAARAWIAANVGVRLLPTLPTNADADAREVDDAGNVAAAAEEEVVLSGAIVDVAVELPSS